MNTTLYIPKKLNVGFCKRHDTYNGKLGYVIYWDDKNKLRKETSWQNWRDKSVAPEIFENVPTEGFILNREVGGVRNSYSWDSRVEKVRVYDPRGFEFEISIPNLLFILQEVNSIKGKGLDGKFVYSWSGKELVLLPVECDEYKQSSTFTKLQGKKITKESMIPGNIYKFKDNQECVYLGRHDHFYIYTPFQIDNPNSKHKYDKKIIKYYHNTSIKYHIFIPITHLNSTTNYRIESGFTKIGEILNDIPIDNYAELLDKYLKSEYGSKIVDIKIKSIPYTNIDIIQNYNVIPVLFNNYVIFFEIRQNHKYVDGKYVIIDEFEIHVNGSKIYLFEDNEFRYYDFIYKINNKYIQDFIDMYNTQTIKYSSNSYSRDEIIYKKFTKNEFFDILKTMGKPDIKYIFESGGIKTIA